MYAAGDKAVSLFIGVNVDRHRMILRQFSYHLIVRCVYKSLQQMTIYNTDAELRGDNWYNIGKCKLRNAAGYRGMHREKRYPPRNP
jgi:hypothetical protein